MNRLIKHIVLGITLCGMTVTAWANSEDLRHYIDLFRSDLNANKQQVIIKALQLTTDEAKVFWPIYLEYEAEFNKLGDERLALLEEFMKAHKAGTLDEKNSTAMADKWFGLQQKRIELWKKYYKKFVKALSPKRALQFLQVEHQVSLFIDLGVASELPLLGSQTKE